jgi:solute carrier family 44 protein 1 (choline transporter-like protein)/choline transporter-like protein 2/4/5
MVVTMFWMYLLQWFAGIFVWLVIIIANVVFIVGATWLYFYWQMKLAIINNTTYELVGNQVFDQVASLAGLNQGYATSYQVNALMYAFYTVAVLAGLLLLITIALFKRILIAVAVLRQASSAMMKMKAIGNNFINNSIFSNINVNFHSSKYSLLFIHIGIHGYTS